MKQSKIEQLKIKFGTVKNENQYYEHLKNEYHMKSYDKCGKRL